MDRSAAQDDKSKSVNIATVRDVLKNMIEAMQFNLKEETIDKKKLDMVRGYLVCYKNYSKSKTLFRYIREYLNTQSKLVPVYRVIYLWIVLYFYEDFWFLPRSPQRKRLFELITHFQNSNRSNSHPNVRTSVIQDSTNSGHSSSVHGSAIQNPHKNHTEVQFEINRIKLLLIRKHRQCINPKFSLLNEPIKSESKKRSIFSFGTVYVAEQLTILETELFRQIELIEFINPKHQRSHRLKAFVERSNNLTFCVASYILAQPEPSQQVRVIKYFLSVAQICEKFGNFNSLFGIMNCFHLNLISRLSSLWKLDSSTVFMLHRFMRLTKPDNNNGLYRKYLTDHYKDKFILPYLGLILKDLTFTRDGNADLISGKVNLEKLDLMTNLLAKVVAYQQKECPLKSPKNPRLVQLLTCLCHWSEERLTLASNKLKPPKNIVETESLGSEILDSQSISELSQVGFDDDAISGNSSGLVDLSSYDEESFQREIARFA